MPSLNAPLQGGVRVHSVLSGDTIVVRPVQMTAGNNPKESNGTGNDNGLKVLHVAGLAAPRMGSRERDDEVSDNNSQPISFGLWSPSHDLAHSTPFPLHTSRKHSHRENSFVGSSSAENFVTA